MLGDDGFDLFAGERYEFGGGALASVCGRARGQSREKEIARGE